MTMKTQTTISKGIEWVVVEDGVIRRLHRSYRAACRRRGNGYVAATPVPRVDALALRVGDRCRIDCGMVLPL